MTKLWKPEEYYPQKYVALYDEAANRIDPFEIKIGRSVEVSRPLSFYFGEKVKFAQLKNIDVILSNKMIPIANNRTKKLIEDYSAGDVQFIECILNTSEGQMLDFWAMNFIKKISAIDHSKSKPIIVKIPGFGDEVAGYRELVLIDDIPEFSIARVFDYLPYIAVRDELADMLVKAKIKGIRFTPGILGPKNDSSRIQK